MIFFALAMLASFSYMLQSFLIGKWARKLPPMIGGTIRSLGLGITMLPLLFFVKDDFSVSSLDSSFWIKMSICALLATISQWGFFFAYRYLPVAIAVSSFRGLILLYTAGFGVIFLGDHFNAVEVILIIAIIFGLALLTLGKKQNKKVKNFHENYSKGFLIQLLAMLFLSMSIIIIAHLSRNYDPAFVGWMWEAQIGWISFVCVFLLSRMRIITIDWSLFNISNFSQIALAASPTIFATGIMSYAITLGSVAAFNAIGNITIVASGLFGWWFYREKLALWQWAGIVIIACGVSGFGLIS